jgi:redox-sensitive bicupin YhaK (pirin superfamily)
MSSPEGPFSERKERRFSFELEGENYFDMNARPLSPTESWPFSMTEEGRYQSRGVPGEAASLLWKTPRGIRGMAGPHSHEHREELQEAFEDLQRGTFIRNSG